MDLSAAINTLLTTGRDDTRTVLIRPESFPADHYIQRENDGSVEVLQAPPPIRRHEFASLRGIQVFCAAPPTCLDIRKFEVDVAANSITVDFDRNRPGRDLGSLELEDSREFEIVRELAKAGGKCFDSKQLRIMFRQDLADAYDNESNLLAILSNLNFKAAADNAANRDHATEALGASVHAQVNAAAADGTEIGTLPDVITLNVRRWSNTDFGKRHAVRVFVEIEPHEQKLRLMVNQNDIERATWNAIDDVCDTLSGIVPESVPIVASYDRTGPPDEMPADTTFALPSSQYQDTEPSNR